MHLVTGATGFLGSAVARRLLAAGNSVRVTVRKGSDRRNLQGLDVEVVTADLRDSASMARAMKGCDAVFHVAADYRLWTRDVEGMFKTNVDGSVAIVRAAMDAGIQRIVYTSSVAVLGIDPTGTPANEETPVSFADMIGPYKQSKFRAEEAVRALIADEGAPVVIVNPSTPIGPRDVKPTPTGKVIVDAATGKIPAFVDTGLNVAHVDDVAEGHVLAFHKGQIGERYILGGDDMALADILRVVAETVGRKPPTVKLPHGLIMPIAYMAEAWATMFGGEPFVVVDGVKMARKKMFFSCAKAETDLGYTHRAGGDAIRDAVAWFQAEGYV